MPIDLYYMEASAPCRSVMMAAKMVGAELNLKKTDVMAGDNMKPEYLKMNPQHNIPTIDDNGFYLNESRAICAYLVNAYGKDDTLYPKDAKVRALVDQRLYFDMGVFYHRFGLVYVMLKITLSIVQTLTSIFCSVSHHVQRGHEAGREGSKGLQRSS